MLKVPTKTGTESRLILLVVVENHSFFCAFFKVLTGLNLLQ